MEQLSGLTELAIIIASGVVAAFVSNRIKLPSILGYLLAGIVLSLVLPRELLQSEWIGNFAQLGAALLLFAIGVEFSFENIAKVRNIVIAGSIVQAVVTLLLGLVLFPLLFGISQFHAFLIAALFSTSSTALVVKILETKGEIYTKTSNIMVGWLIMQDLMIVAWFVLFQTFAPNAQAGGDIIMAIITTAFVIGVALGVGKFVLPYIMKQVAETKSDELLIVTTVAVIVAFSVFANALGISFTIGAFLAGLSLSESFLNHEIFTEIKPLRNLFMMVFFVSIGSLFDVNAVFDQIGFIVFALIIFLVLKAAVIVIINLWFDVHIKSALKVGLGLFQVGEFAFLGAQLALHQNWIDSKLYAAIIATTVLSMALTPVLLNSINSVYKFLEHRLRLSSPNLYRALFLNNSYVDENELKELKGHIVICGHGRVGKYVSAAIMKSQLPFVVIEMEATVAEQLNNEGVNVIFGDATNPDILKSAGIETARVLVAALPITSDVEAVVSKARELNPKIKILARSHEEYASLELVDISIEPEFEAAVQIVNNLYRMMRRPAEDSNGIVKFMRKNAIG